MLADAQETSRHKTCSRDLANCAALRCERLANAFVYTREESEPLLGEGCETPTTPFL